MKNTVTTIMSKFGFGRDLENINMYLNSLGLKNEHIKDIKNGVLNGIPHKVDVIVKYDYIDINGESFDSNYITAYIDLLTGKIDLSKVETDSETGLKLSKVYYYELELNCDDTYSYEHKMRSSNLIELRQRVKLTADNLSDEDYFIMYGIKRV